MEGEYWEIDENGHFLLYLENGNDLVLEGDIDDNTAKEWKQIQKEREEKEKEKDEEEEEEEDDEDED